MSAGQRIAEKRGAHPAFFAGKRSLKVSGTRQQLKLRASRTLTHQVCAAMNQPFFSPPSSTPSFFQMFWYTLWSGFATFASSVEKYSHRSATSFPRPLSNRPRVVSSAPFVAAMRRKLCESSTSEHAASEGRGRMALRVEMMGSVREESKVERVVEGEADEAGTSECMRRMRGRVFFKTWPMGLCGKVSQTSTGLLECKTHM